MHFPTVILALASLASLGRSQVVDPEDISEGTRLQWCVSQTESCPLICLQLPNTDGEPSSNDCDYETLSFSCVCSNGLTPNASEYSQTIPYFTCSERNNRCVVNCNGDPTCQTECRTKNPCGAQSPKRVNVTSTTTTTGPTGSSTSKPSDAVYTGLGDGSASEGDSDENAAMRTAVELGQVYGFGVVAAGFLAGFAILL
ncbi:hypothetical protein AJ80_05217 [Polytolypa hystricis UAMH7299]|uniref:DUF7707 domain-containing protein n=1 Tax=Polytolypa hystricis (strain UAMH7299) TaxID=1447883 RepID=A0A2B7Y6Y4_POLH7|nr:hypothetical protein AJ80_05217 [Polytolypa hystricis UAMH7299]